MCDVFSLRDIDHDASDSVDLGFAMRFSAAGLMDMGALLYPHFYFCHGLSQVVIGNADAGMPEFG